MQDSDRSDHRPDWRVHTLPSVEKEMCPLSLPLGQVFRLYKTKSVRCHPPPKPAILARSCYITSLFIRMKPQRLLSSYIEFGIISWPYPIVTIRGVFANCDKSQLRESSIATSATKHRRYIEDTSEVRRCAKRYRRHLFGTLVRTTFICLSNDRHAIVF